MLMISDHDQCKYANNKLLFVKLSYYPSIKSIHTNESTNSCFKVAKVQREKGRKMKTELRKKKV